ncbi:MAG: DUF3662 and FHA domain-containing protein [Micrococcaceae bacterium]
MGLMDRFERTIEKGVRQTFNRGGGELSPVDLASRLRREMDEKSMNISEGRTLAPNLFEIDLSPEDYQRAQSWGAALADELCQVGMDHARSQNYHLSGPVSVTFGDDQTLEPGVFGMESYIVKDEQQKAATPAQQVQQTSARPVFQEPRQMSNANQQTPEAATVAMGSQTLPKQAVIDLDGQRYTLNASSIIIGRSTTADIMVDDPGVSRRHLEIQVKGPHAYAVDLGSTNGSFINGRRLQGSIELHDGNTITIGHAKAVFRWIDA